MTLMPKTLLPVHVKAKLFRGLGDPSRLSILEALRDGPRTVGEIAALTGLKQPNASTHLNCLWCCGLVERAVRGNRRYYSIRPRKVGRILDAAGELLADVSGRIEECSRYGE